jgi:hypothetical protein
MAPELLFPNKSVFVHFRANTSFRSSDSVHWNEALGRLEAEPAQDLGKECARLRCRYHTWYQQIFFVSLSAGSSPMGRLEDSLTI